MVGMGYVPTESEVDIVGGVVRTVDLLGAVGCMSGKVLKTW